MWIYEKRLQYPVRITKTCPKTAQLIISQYGGPDGELSASMRYLSQRFTMPCKKVGGLLTDIGTEELAHLEIICAMVYQLTKNLTLEEAETAGFDAYYIDHTKGIWPQAASSVPFTSLEFQSKGDVFADLHEDLAAEQKARTTYDNLLRMIKDPEAREPLKFLRAREIVHFQRFGEALEIGLFRCFFERTHLVSPFWCMFYIFLGSMLSFVMMLLYTKIDNKIFFFGSAILLFYFVDQNYLAFIIGLIAGIIANKEYSLSKWKGALLVAVGCVLGLFPPVLLPSFIDIVTLYALGAGFVRSNRFCTI